MAKYILVIGTLALMNILTVKSDQISPVIQNLLSCFNHSTDVTGDILHLGQTPQSMGKVTPFIAQVNAIISFIHPLMFQINKIEKKELLVFNNYYFIFEAFFGNHGKFRKTFSVTFYAGRS